MIRFSHVFFSALFALTAFAPKYAYSQPRHEGGHYRVWQSDLTPQQIQERKEERRRIRDAIVAQREAEGNPMRQPPSPEERRALRRIVRESQERQAQERQSIKP